MKDIRAEIEKIITSNMVVTKNLITYFKERAVDQILALIEGIVPPEQKREHELGDYTTAEIDQIEKDALAAIKYTEGYNQCRADIKKRLGDE
jgi:hypothetical protein